MSSKNKDFNAERANFGPAMGGTPLHARCSPYFAALALSLLTTAVAFPLYPQFNVTNVAMLYLLATTLVALRLGRGPAVFVSFLNVLLLDYLFIPPIFSLDVDDLPYVFTLVVMCIVALVITNLVTTIQRHRDTARARERHYASLYAMSRELCVAQEPAAMAAVAVKHIDDTFHADATVLHLDTDAEIREIAGGAGAAAGEIRHAEIDFDIVRQVVASSIPVSAALVYVPLLGRRPIQGVLICRPRMTNHALSHEQMHLLNAFAAQLALALERAHSAETAEHAKIEAEKALLRNTMLASISHDLRTPLSAIAGAGSLIALPGYALCSDRRKLLGELIERKAQDMTALLSNILRLTEIECGGARRMDWHSLEELVEHSLCVNQTRLAQHRVHVDLPADLPLIRVEATLIVQILNNLLENAAKYTPADTRVEIRAQAGSDGILIEVSDDGPGLPPGDPARLFAKFQRGRAESNVAGVGLGLAICKAAAELHGGDIRAMNRPGGGTRFAVRLPVKMCAESAVHAPMTTLEAPA